MSPFNVFVLWLPQSAQHTLMEFDFPLPICRPAPTKCQSLCLKKNCKVNPCRFVVSICQSKQSTGTHPTPPKQLLNALCPCQTPDPSQHRLLTLSFYLLRFFQNSLPTPTLQPLPLLLRRKTRETPKKNQGFSLCRSPKILKRHEKRRRTKKCE